MAWRDVYSLACLLLSVSHSPSLNKATSPASLPSEIAQTGSSHPQQTNQTPGHAADACSAAAVDPEEKSQADHSTRVSAEQDRLAATMKELDMAVIMGGLRFRPRVNAAIKMVQERYLQLSRQDSASDVEDCSTKSLLLWGSDQRVALKRHCSTDGGTEQPRKRGRSWGSLNAEDGTAQMPLPDKLESLSRFADMGDSWPEATGTDAGLPAGT